MRGARRARNASGPRRSSPLGTLSSDKRTLSREGNRGFVMHRRLLVLVAFVFSSAAASAADTKITIRWFGQSYFQIVSGAGTKVIIDPHLIESYPRAINAADLVLITHNHMDHNQIDAIESKERAKILVGCKGTGRKQEWNPIDEKFKDIHIRTVG